MRPASFPRRPTRDPVALVFMRLGSWPAWTHAALGLCIAVLIATIDRASGPSTSLAVFQLIPLAMVAWFVSRPVGVALAATAGAAWYWDFSPLLPPGTPAAIQVWSCVSRVAFFMLVVWLVAALRELYEQQRALATTDDLTGVANRRALLDAITLEISRSGRTRASLSLVYLDCDHFKLINDRFGHASGDKLLRAIAHTLETTVRRNDLVARIGGDEFAVLLPEAGADAALKAAGKIRNVLAIAMQAHDWPVTFSIGVATFPTPPPSAEAMLARADELQYAAKHGGRNGIVQQAVAA